MTVEFEVTTLKATQLLYEIGQSIWLDNITRDLLDNGTLETYIRELSVTGLTSNPTIFEQAIKKSAAYEVPIRERIKKRQVRGGPLLRLGTGRPYPRC